MSLKLWSYHFREDSPVELRSDSLGALGSISKFRSSSPGVNKIVAEMTLIEAYTGAKIAKLTHIPGVSNEWPDALSRLSAPLAKQVPAQLSGVARERCEPRGSSFWLTTNPPKSKRLRK